MTDATRYALIHLDPAGGEAVASWHPSPELAKKSAYERADGRVYLVQDNLDKTRTEPFASPSGPPVLTEADVAPDADAIPDPDPLSAAEVAPE